MIIRKKVVKGHLPTKNSNDVTCDKCDGYLPGHAIGGFDICTCTPITRSASAATSCLLNKKATKEYALKISRDRRAGKFKRVSADFLKLMEDNLKRMIDHYVTSKPSKGKTI